MTETQILQTGEDIVKNSANYDEQKISSTIESLRDILRFHNRKYYLDEAPLISDFAYDRLFHILKKWEEKFPTLKTPDSPTARIDLEVQGELKKVQHLTSMLSLENAFSEEDLVEWHERICKFLEKDEIPTFTVELKFDGLGISAVYEHDQLIRVVTRGDGEIGEDVTLNAKTLPSVPLRANFSQYGAEQVELRGEVVLKKNDFELLNAKRAESGESLFANPRNAASGSIRQLDPAVTAERKLTAFFYQISFWKPEKTAPEEYATVPKLFQNLHFLTSPFFVHCRNISEVFMAIQKISANKEEFDFEIDGAVIKVNELAFRQKIGETNHHPRWAIAYKFPAKQEHTKLLNVEWQVGRTGVLTPVAHLEPVHIGGVQVSRATLHNADEIERKDFRIGDMVVIERAGEVIPKVIIPLKERRNGQEKSIAIPQKCPVCNSRVVKNEGEVAIRCDNLSCPEQVKGRLIHFASKGALDIENLGKETVELLVEKNLIRDFSDIFSLKYEQLAELEGFKEKSIMNLLSGISAAKKQPLWRFITALGIPLVGNRTAKDLAVAYPIFWDLVSAQPEELETIEGIGPEVSSSIHEFLQTQENITLFKKLEQVGFSLSKNTNTEGNASQIFAGKTFVFTGTMKTLERRVAEELIESLGGKASNSVSKNTDFVVCGENAGSKKEKAEELKVAILSEDEFLELVGKEEKGKRKKGKEENENLSLF